MNNFLLIALAVPVVIAVVFFLARNERLWARFVYCIFSVISICAAYRICKDDAGKLRKMETDVKSSQQLLKKAERDLTQQTARIQTEVEKMNLVIHGSNAKDSILVEAISRIQHHVKTLEESSRLYNYNIIESPGIHFSNSASDVELLHSEETDAEQSGANLNISNE